MWSFAQTSTPAATTEAPKNFYSKDYEVYYKTTDDIKQIAQNFMASVCMVGAVQGDVVTSHFSMPYKSPNNGCLSVTIEGDVLIYAWNNKTAIEFKNMKYTMNNEKTSCEKSGELSTLYNCSSCRISIAKLKDAVNNYTGTIAKKYGVYIAKINSPDGYKIYSYDYGPQAHMTYALAPADKKAPANKSKKRK